MADKQGLRTIGLIFSGITVAVILTAFALVLGYDGQAVADDGGFPTASISTPR